MKYSDLKVYQELGPLLSNEFAETILLNAVSAMYCSPTWFLALMRKRISINTTAPPGRRGGAALSWCGLLLGPLWGLGALNIFEKILLFR
jgi:hypothetical protein